MNMNTGRQGAACCELRKRGFHRDNSVPTGVMPQKRAERRYLMNTSVTKCEFSTAAWNPERECLLRHTPMAQAS